MTVPAENSSSLPREADGEVRVGSSASALPIRKRSRSFEEEGHQTMETSQRDEVSKKMPRRLASLSCTRPGETRQEAEDCLSRLSAEPGETDQDVEDIGPDPIPDPCYGLLGALHCEDAPGHICSLPREVLRHIFAFLPVEDLYCSVSLVCHLWREIIIDPLVSKEPSMCVRLLHGSDWRISFVLLASSCQHIPVFYSQHMVCCVLGRLHLPDLPQAALIPSPYPKGPSCHC